MAGTLTVDTVKSSTANPPAFQNTSGVEVGQLCRAWVNFNGVTTATIRASFNVSSVTRKAVGDYTVNFSNALPDANYAVAATAQYTASGANICHIKESTTPTTSAVSLKIYNTLSGNIDSPIVGVSVFR